MSMYGVEYSPLLCGKGRTKQAMRDECDINLIMARYSKTGLLTHLAEGIPQFVDVSEVGDYRAATENVRRVEEYFMGLPSQVRKEFDNDAAAFMEFLESGASEDDLRELGLKVVGDRRARRRDSRSEDLEAAALLKEEAAAAAILAAAQDST